MFSKNLLHERLCSRYAFADIDTIVDAAERGVFDKSDEEVIDEYADRYDENENQTVAPDDEEIDDHFANNDDCRISSRDKENTNIPVIDMVKTGKNIRNIMNLEGVKPTLTARITGHSLQAIYDWLG